MNINNISVCSEAKSIAIDFLCRQLVFKKSTFTMKTFSEPEIFSAIVDFMVKTRANIINSGCSKKPKIRLSILFINFHDFNRGSCKPDFYFRNFADGLFSEQFVLRRSFASFLFVSLCMCQFQCYYYHIIFCFFFT